jgi:hypothetical protein
MSMKADEAKRHERRREVMGNASLKAKKTGRRACDTAASRFWARGWPTVTGSRGCRRSRPEKSDESGTGWDESGTGWDESGTGWDESAAGRSFFVAVAAISRERKDRKRTGIILDLLRCSIGTGNPIAVDCRENGCEVKLTPRSP